LEHPKPAHHDGEHALRDRKDVNYDDTKRKKSAKRSASSSSVKKAKGRPAKKRSASKGAPKTKAAAHEQTHHAEHTDAKASVHKEAASDKKRKTGNK
jgi:hypothetical protein